MSELLIEFSQTRGIMYIQTRVNTRHVTSRRVSQKSKADVNCSLTPTLIPTLRTIRP